jgi:hypothetical protein
LRRIDGLNFSNHRHLARVHLRHTHFWDRDRQNDQDDRDNNQQLDQRETA